MNLQDALGPYRELMETADLAFEDFSASHPDLVRCVRGCDDCCHAVFGLFLVEAASIHIEFQGLEESLKRETIERCKAADRAAARLESELRACRHEPDRAEKLLAVERIPCPLLTGSRDCALYGARPLTCRIYGIPTVVRGALKACPKSGFSEKGRFGAFNLDMAQKQLLDLSTGMIEDIEEADPGKASLLVSVSKALMSPVHEIIEENYLKDAWS